ncbi:MAG: hypothetical protein ACLTOX_01870 [Streptococcus thermophilus]
MHGRRLIISDAFLCKLVQLLVKSWKAITQKFLRKTLSRKLLNVKKKPFAYYRCRFKHA